MRRGSISLEGWHITDTVGVAGVWELEKLGGLLDDGASGYGMVVDVGDLGLVSETIPDGIKTFQTHNTGFP